MHIKKEIDSDVKERILLVRRIRIDSHKEASKVAEKRITQIQMVGLQVAR
ncbi:MAG: hypothetical protein ABJB76_03780 [Candidatus Nitrosocosmicus sp.]